MLDLVPIAGLKKDDHNPRRMSELQRKRLRDSVLAFGMVVPIVVRKEDKLVIGGHQRLVAAEELGLTEVPVMWWQGDDLQARTLNLALNKIEGEWDEDKLATILAELGGVETLSEALTAFDFSLTDLAGFDGREVLHSLQATLSDERSEDLLALARSLSASPPVETRARVGDFYALGAHHVLCGDSTDTNQVERLIGGEPASMLFTDPPYGVDYSADEGAERAPSGRSGGRRARPLGSIASDNLGPEEHGAFISAVLTNAAKALLPGASVYVCGGTSNTTAYDAAFEATGFTKSSIIVWNKLEFSFGRRDYQSAFELVYYGWRRGASHRFYGGRSQSDIWEVPRDPGAAYLHPTQKPVALAERAIRNSSLAGDIVLDLFGGSGSTLIAAEKSGRCARLTELEPRFVDVIIARWEALTGKRASLLTAADRA